MQIGQRAPTVFFLTTNKLMDQFTEVTEVSWLDRYKSALLGFTFAPLFFFAGFHALKHGEKRHAFTTTGLKEVIHSVQSLEVCF